MENLTETENKRTPIEEDENVHKKKLKAEGGEMAVDAHEKLTHPDDDRTRYLKEAARLTFIFHKEKDGGFENILKPGELIVESNKITKYQELIPYYKEWIKNNGNVASILPTEEEERKKYHDLAFKLAKESFQPIPGRYVNPMNYKVISVKSPTEVDDTFVKGVEQNISDYIERIESLPHLYKEYEYEFGWEKSVTALYKMTDEGKSDIKSENDSINGRIPPNFVHSENGNEEAGFIDPHLMEIDGRNHIFYRQNFKGNAPMQVKPYDILKMRDYLRILRRLWNLSRLFDRKEITTFDENKKVIRHPYFEKHPLKEKIYARMYNARTKLGL